MAKWGEGDPRWIVEERPDAVNVNNWHWTEKNACSWSQAKFKELFTNFRISHEGFKARITEVEKAEGEANANNRKAKLIFFYEWELTLKWRGKLFACDDYLNGKIVIPNLSEENDLHEIEVDISVDETTKEAQQMKELMYKFSRDIIREQLGKYITDLKEEFSKGMILPKKDKVDVKVTSPMDDLSNAASNLKMHTPAKTVKKESVKSNDVGTKLETSTLTLTEKFQCSCNELYSALTVPELVMAFTQGPVKHDFRPGGTFEYFGGSVVGEFIELVTNERIVQKWRVRRWPSGVFSNVTIQFKQEANHTELYLIQTGLPSVEFDSTKENWERYYWEPVKRIFGFGSYL